MNKKALFFIDDVIWVFRDLARQKPKSIFDHPFLSLLKELHDDYGTRTQLNVFCVTDHFYGNDIFSLDEMPDTYKDEFTACSDWLKFGFHARSEFPDYPYINASYEQVAEDLGFMKRETLRFAGENTFSRSTTPHWRPISKAACKALKDGGIRLLSATYGEKIPFEGNEKSLPYGHDFRLRHNRQPETCLFKREFGFAALSASLCGYNHISTADRNRTQFNCECLLDDETGLFFKDLANTPSLNCITLEETEKEYQEVVDKEFVCYGTHEQYFYEDYFAYQPEYPEKLKAAARILYENGFSFVFGEELL